MRVIASDFNGKRWVGWVYSYWRGPDYWLALVMDAVTGQFTEVPTHRLRGAVDHVEYSKIFAAAKRRMQRKKGTKQR